MSCCALWQSLRQRHVRGRALYVLLGVPTGLAYWIALLAAAAVDGLLWLPRRALPPASAVSFPFARCTWRRLALWERRHMMRLVDIELPLPAELPSSSLAFLLMKLPVAYPVAVFAVFAVVYPGTLAVLGMQRVVQLWQATPPTLPLIVGVWR